MTKLPYNRIISYGCSFTAGSELADHEFLDMPEDELFKYVEKHNIKGSHQLYMSLKLSDETIGDIITCNKTKSWPNFVAKRFDIPLHNRAIPGSSLSCTTYKILNDLHYSAINNDDLVLVGITSPNRWFQFYENGRYGGGVFGIAWQKEFSTTFQEHMEREWANEYNLIYNHFKEITFLSDLSDRLNGQIKLCYAFGAPQYTKHFFKEKLKEKKFSEFFDFCTGMHPHHNFIDNEKSISELAGWRHDCRHHVFGHPRVQFHEQFANILINKMEKMYND
jgi:hypothetical protein